MDFYKNIVYQYPKFNLYFGLTAGVFTTIYMMNRLNGGGINRYYPNL